MQNKWDPFPRILSSAQQFISNAKKHAEEEARYSFQGNVTERFPQISESNLSVDIGSHSVELAVGLGLTMNQ
jgi:exopolyphosphatase/pppGpp-phosphohydrolase